MTKQKGICEECKIEYEYEYNPKYPRKYCPECSAQKKAAFAGDCTYIEKPGVTMEEEPQKRKSVKGTAYEKDPVGLAVEIFCMLWPLSKKEESSLSGEDLMNDCIDIVKQAKESFE